jgi:hypothetical protein
MARHANGADAAAYGPWFFFFRPKPSADYPPPQEGPQLVALQVPQPEPAELVNLPSLEWLKADMSFFTFLLLHFGQDTAWLPRTSVSNVFLHFSQRNSKIGIQI